MLNAENSNGFLTLYEAAQRYLHNGYAVIPICTESDRAKVAAVVWSGYQQRRPTQNEIFAWFVEQRHTGLAIVTGTISRLVVLDFDDLVLFEQFQRLCPDLTPTRTVRTKRGVHLYFHTSTSHNIRSRRGQGVDLKANGSYVVSSPTVIDDHAYTVTQDQEPILLTDSDLSRIQAFIDTQAIPADVGRKVQAAAFSCEIVVPLKSCSTSQETFVTSNGLVDRYHYQAADGSRNDALFYTALRARDNSYGMQQTIDLLVDCHARQAPNHTHKHETYRQRHREAIATITSAYSRPARRQVAPASARAEQLPNSVREKLFQMGCTHTVRVIEGLRQAGIQPGQVLTYAQIMACLAGQVGQWSIRQALKVTLPTGESIFPQIPFAASPNTFAYADTPQANSLTNNAIGSPEKPTFLKSRKRPMGYILPSNEALCLLLKVKQTASDPLNRADLASAKATRMAAHRELIRRRPGIYPRGWLARRLGISAETIDAYNRDIPIHVRHCYYEKPIFWSNLDDIPLSLDIVGTFLEDERGKHYPAKREIAQKLLAGKHTVVYKHQQANFYSYGDDPPQPPLADHWQPPSAATPPQPRIGFPYGAAQTPFQNPSVQEVVASMPVSPMRPLPIAEPPLILRDDTVVQRRLAERVYKTIQRLTTDRAQHMSRANTRRLVETYGAAAVERGLKQLVWYAGKGKVTRPAGFLITTARLAWRELQGGAGSMNPAPRFRGVRVGIRRD